MTGTPTSDFTNTPEPAVERRSSPSAAARRGSSGGRRVLAIMATGLGIPGAFIAISNIGSLDAPTAAIVVSSPDALRTGPATERWPVTRAVLINEGQPANGIASVKPQQAKLPPQSAAAPCLVVAPVDQTPLGTASHGPAEGGLQPSPSIDCLPPGLTAKASVQTASLGAVQVAPKPVTPTVALKELPHAVPRPSQVVIAPLPMAPVSAPAPAPRGLHMRPTIINKGAPLPPPDGMKAPGYVAQTAPTGTPAPQPEARPLPGEQLGVTSAGSAQPVPVPGALGVTAAGKGKTQTAQIGVGQWGNRPPEILPWLEPDGSSRRSSLGGTNRGGSSGQIQVFGKTIAVGAPKWTEDIYKTRN